MIIDNNIRDLIYTIRGKQVMIDTDVAKLYNYETKYINLAVRRNINRFPETFCFQLRENELENLRLQIATANSKNVTNISSQRRTLPYAFTEEGIAMLSGLLKNEIAAQVSINIMHAFVEMRKLKMHIFQQLHRFQN